MFTHTNNFAICFFYERVSNSFIENYTRYYNFANSKWQAFCSRLLQLTHLQLLIDFYFVRDRSHQNVK